MAGGSMLRVATFPYKPHLEVLKGETGDRLVGLLGDVLEALSLSLSFNYSLQLAADRSLGNVLPNGTATGLVGRLQRDVRPARFLSSSHLYAHTIRHPTVRASGASS
ncbi:hypothetical protein V5799_017053 [Amblyomma americanum]|uniref:Ionotropic glutamate receptor L-glutamate and glycine-binding domain-containing protein n=1 Tax=Amblyomma americanum TaxID=6943 RepID=A0AAQ4F3D0_AMBAM